MENKIQQRINDLTQAIKTLKREREFLQKLNYRKCVDCEFLEKTMDKRWVSYECQLQMKRNANARTKACDKYIQRK